MAGKRQAKRIRRRSEKPDYLTTQSSDLASRLDRLSLLVGAELKASEVELELPDSITEAAPERFALSADEVAARTGLSIDTIRRLTTAGELAHVREGRRILYLPSDVRDYLLSRRESARVIPLRGGAA